MRQFGCLIRYHGTRRGPHPIHFVSTGELSGSY